VNVKNILRKAVIPLLFISRGATHTCAMIPVEKNGLTDVDVHHGGGGPVRQVVHGDGLAPLLRPRHLALLLGRAHIAGSLPLLVLLRLLQKNDDDKDERIFIFLKIANPYAWLLV
jgi:hypothetical protein